MSKRSAPNGTSRPSKKPKKEDIADFFRSSPASSSKHEVITLSDSDQEPASTPDKSTQSATATHPFFQPRASTSKVKTEDDLLTPAKTDSKPAIGRTFGAVDNSQQRAEPEICALDKDIFEFDPEIDVDTARWPRSKGSLEIPYSFLTAAFVLISATRSRLIIVTILTNTLRTIVHYQPNALLPAVYLITNHVAPAYEGVELGIGSQVLSKSLKDVSGTTAKQLSTYWKQYGDMGDVAFAAKSAVRTLIPAPPLSMTGVYNTLLKICALRGQGVTNQKASLVTKMLVAAKGEEVRFLVRTLVAHLRIGAVRLTVTAALARCFCLIGPGREGFAIEREEMTGVKATAKTIKEGKEDPRRKALMERLAKAEALMRRVYVRHPNYDDIIPALLKEGLQSLEETVPLSVGTPLCNMLGQITRNLDDVSSRLQPETEFVAEWKYDGQRVQIHAHRLREGEAKAAFTRDLSGKKKGGKFIGDRGDIFVRLFSRHLEDMTDKYPDVLQLVVELMESGKVESFIMDAEIVAIDADSGDLLNFQTLSNRARKDVQIGDVKVKAKVFAFDLMHYNGRSLLTETFRIRRGLLHEHFLPRSPTDLTTARFDHVANMALKNTPEDMDIIAAFMSEATSNKCEGLMIKILDHEMVPTPAAVKSEQDDPDPEDEVTQIKEEVTADIKPIISTASPKKSRRKLLLSSYEPDKRADSWMKVKKDYSETGGDSFDLVPIAAWHGQGRKVGWWSPILLATYDPETDSFQAVCKCISGFTDQFYKDLNERYPKDSETCSKLPFVDADTGLRPDWYFKPKEVWEMRGADITLSPVYPAAQGRIPGSDRGLSMRFPRFMKLREDKSIEQATTPQELAEAYFRQEAGRKEDGPSKAGTLDRTVKTKIGDSDEEEEEYPDEEEQWADVLE